MILTSMMKQRKDANILATRRKRGMQICHLDGFFQKSCLAGVQLGGGVSGSAVVSSSSPISDRLPLRVSLRVMAVPVSLGSVRRLCNVLIERC